MSDGWVDQDKAEQLKAIVLRLEALDDEAAAINADKREVRKEAKLTGFDLPTLRRLIERRRLAPETVIEADALLETYEAALGCGAAAGGVLTTARNADGIFEVKMVSAADAGDKLSKAAKARQAAMLQARLAERAREGGP